MSSMRAVALGMTMVAWAGTACAGGEAPRAIVQQVSDQVVAVLGNHGLSADEKR